MSGPELNAGLDPSVLPFYYICSAAGFLVVVGGLWLLYERRLDLNQVVKETSKIKIFFLSLQTGSPALIFFAIGVALLAYPIEKTANAPRTATITGKVESDVFPVAVYAVIGSDSLQNSRAFGLNVPLLAKDETYKVVYVAGPKIIEDLALLSQNGDYSLQPKSISGGDVPHFPAVSSTTIPSEFKTK